MDFGVFYVVNCDRETPQCGFETLDSVLGANRDVSVFRHLLQHVCLGHLGNLLLHLRDLQEIHPTDR